MAKTSMKIKQQRAPKFSTRAYTRCRICGRPHSVLKKYGICRVCFREQHTRDRSQALKKLVGKPESNLVNTSAYAMCELSARAFSELSEENFLSATAVFINNYINKHI